MKAIKAMKSERLKSFMTRTATNTIEESAEDGKLKLDDCNVAMEMQI